MIPAYQMADPGDQKGNRIMDPNANLTEQREIVRRMMDPDSLEIDTGDAVRLAELVHALDCWLTNGNAVPNRWNRSKRLISDLTEADVRNMG